MWKDFNFLQLCLRGVFSFYNEIISNITFWTLNKEEIWIIFQDCSYGSKYNVTNSCTEPNASSKSCILQWPQPG